MRAVLVRSFAVFYAIAVGGVAVLSIVARSLGLGVHSRAWGVLGVVVMWMPAVGAFVATRTVDRVWISPLRLSLSLRGARLSSWLVPLLISHAIYGAAWAAGLASGEARFGPRWTGASSIAINLAINFVLVSVLFAIGAAGEELGWRGYLQPRLEALGVRFSVVWVAL